MLPHLFVVEAQEVRGAGEFLGHPLGVVHGEGEGAGVVEDRRGGLAAVEEREELLEAVVLSGSVGVPRDRRLVVLRPTGGEDRERALAALRGIGRRRHRREEDARERSRRSLRVGVERPDRLHLLEPELDTHRLGEVRGEDVDEAAADGEVAAFGDEVGPRVPLRDERGDEASHLDALSRRHDQAPFPDVLGSGQDPEECPGRNHEEIDVPLGEPGERPVLLAPHLQRRRDPLVRRQRRRREERDARGAEDRRRVPVEGRGVPLVRADDDPLQPQRRRRGAKEVGQKSRRGTDERHPSRSILEDPSLEARQKARHGGRGGDLFEDGVPPALHGRDYPGVGPGARCQA